MPTSAPTPPLLSRMTLVAAMLLFAASSVSADGDEVDCSGMKTKALRQWLAARALKCDGCTEKADFVALCENNKDAPLAKPPDLNDKQMPNFMRTPGQKEDASIDDILGSLKGMPGMENVKVFSADDIAGMEANGMEKISLGKDGKGGKSKPRSTKKSAAAYRADVKDFYTKFGIEHTEAGIDAAMEKWKGREERIMGALYKKYKDEMDEYYNPTRGGVPSDYQVHDEV